MKKLYLVCDGHNVKQFTVKKAADRYYKQTLKNNPDTTLTETIKYPDSYISLMKWQYKLYKLSTYTDIYAAYKTMPSKWKINSFYRIKNSIDMPETLKVISANCQVYTTGSLTTDAATGELYFRYDTRDYVRTIPLALIEK